MAVNRETLEHRKAHNLCPRDGRPNKPGRKLCEYCLNKAAKKTERYRERKIKGGLCTNCGTEKPIGTSRLCLGCKDKASDYCHNAHVKRYESRKTMNKCTLCDDNAAPGKTACQPCLDKRASIKKAKHDQNRNDGLCSQCGKTPPTGKGKRCQVCIDKRNEWYQGSPTQSKDKARRDENRETVIKHYGGKCVECGESKPPCLAIDHIDGGGNTHRKEIGKYGSGFFKWLVDNNFPEGFQILCHNCNISKHLSGSTRTVKTRYVYKGKGEPQKLDLDL